MHINITEKKENLFLKRIEVRGILNFKEATPSNIQLTEELAKEMDCDNSLIIVKHINTKFSHSEANFEAFVYKSKEAKDKTEKKAPHEKKKEKVNKKEGGQ